MEDHRQQRPPDSGPRSRGDTVGTARCGPEARGGGAAPLRNFLAGVEPGGVHPEFLRRLSRRPFQPPHPFTLSGAETPPGARGDLFAHQRGRGSTGSRRDPDPERGRDRDFLRGGRGHDTRECPGPRLRKNIPPRGNHASPPFRSPSPVRGGDTSHDVQRRELAGTRHRESLPGEAL